MAEAKRTECQWRSGRAFLLALVARWQGDRLKDKTPATQDLSYYWRRPRIFMIRHDCLSWGRLSAEPTQRTNRCWPRQSPILPSASITQRRAELAPAEKYLKIVSAFRSREYQEQLRRQSPNAGSAGLAVNSPHFTGRALDLYVGGEPVDSKDSNRAVQVSTPVYRWLVQNARRFGFRPYFYEPWHWEYVG